MQDSCGIANVEIQIVYTAQSVLNCVMHDLIVLIDEQSLGKSRKMSH